MIVGLFLFWGFGSEAVGIVDVDAWAYHRSDYEEYTAKNKWHAEPLPHIQCHIGFECYLIVLYKFDEESAAEQYGEEYAEYQPGAFFGVALPIEPHQESKECQIAQCFINLRWVASLSDVIHMPFD